MFVTSILWWLIFFILTLRILIRKPDKEETKMDKLSELIDAIHSKRLWRTTIAPSLKFSESSDTPKFIIDGYRGFSFGVETQDWENWEVKEIFTSKNTDPILLSDLSDEELKTVGYNLPEKVRGWLTDSDRLSDEIARLFIVEMESYLYTVRAAKKIRKVAPLNWNTLEVELERGRFLRDEKLTYTIKAETVSFCHRYTDEGGYIREWYMSLPLSNTSLVFDLNLGISNLSSLCQTPEAKELLKEFSSRIL